MKSSLVLSESLSTTPREVTTTTADNDDIVVDYCASFLPIEEETVMMQSDDSSTGGGSNPSDDRRHHDPPATAEFNNGQFRSINGEPFLRIVEQENIEVSAEIFVDDDVVDDHPSERRVVEIQQERHSQIMGDPSIHCEAIAEESEHAEVACQAAEIEIEEEDLDTRARDLMPGVAQAVQQPNLHEVNVEQSNLSVSALTTTFALEEDFKPPAFPTHTTANERTSSGGDSSENQQVIFDDRTVSAMDVACADDASTPLPNFKCQSQEYQQEAPAFPPLPSPSPLAVVQVSGSSNTTRTDSTPDEIPVAPAVLVPEEHLSSRDRSPPHSTLTRSIDGTPILPKPDRNFWMTIIAIMLTLNSILVGGIVVAGFCAAGKCASNESSSPNDVAPVALVPTPAPSRRLSGASVAPTFNIGVSSIPNLPGVPEFAPPTESFPIDMNSDPGTSDSTLISLTPNFSPMDEGIARVDPDEKFDDPDQPIESTDKQGISTRLLVLIGVLCEAMIIVTMFCFYRRWRNRRLAAAIAAKPIQDAGENESASSTAAV